MRSVTWRKFREIVSVDEGTLPDGIVEGLTVAGWQLILDAIVDAGWRTEYIDGDGVPGPLPRAADALPVPSGQGYRLLRVWPWPTVQVNVWLCDLESFEFDIDSRELRGEAETEAVMAFIQMVGMLTGHLVRMTPEGSCDTAMVSYDPQTDAFQIPR